MNIPLWTWWLLAGSSLYALLALVMLVLSFGWRYRLALLRRQLEEAEMTRPQLISRLQAQMNLANWTVRGAHDLQWQLTIGLVQHATARLLVRLLMPLFPRRLVRWAGGGLEALISYAAGFVTRAVRPLFQMGGSVPPSNIREGASGWYDSECTSGIGKRGEAYR